MEAACFLLMAVLCTDVFLGVFSRYVLARTFTWYDEIARACFVWMIFLGAAVGIRRHAHFRLHLVVDKLPPRVQQALAVFAFLVTVGFAGALIQQGWILVELGSLQRTPVMGISKAWIYSAIPAGGALIILYALPSLWRALSGLIVGGAPLSHPVPLSDEERV